MAIKLNEKFKLTELLKNTKFKKRVILSALGIITGLGIIGFLFSPFNPTQAEAASSFCFDNMNCIGTNYVSRIENLNDSGYICSWAYDASNRNNQLKIKFYIDGQPIDLSYGETRLDPRNNDYSCSNQYQNNSFVYVVPEQYQDNRNHNFYFCVIDEQKTCYRSSNTINFNSQNFSNQSNNQIYSQNQNYNQYNGNYFDNYTTNLDDIRVVDQYGSFEIMGYAKSQSSNETARIEFYSNGERFRGGRLIGNTTVDFSGRFNARFNRDILGDQNAVRIYAYVVVNNDYAIINGSPKYFEVPRNQTNTNVIQPQQDIYVDTIETSSQQNTNSQAQQTQTSTNQSQIASQQQSQQTTSQTQDKEELSQDNPWLSGNKKLSYENEDPKYIDLDGDSNLAKIVSKHANCIGTQMGSSEQLDTLRRQGVIYRNGGEWYFNGSRAAQAVSSC